MRGISTIRPLKPALIGLGLYKPARWLFDHAISRNRLRDQKRRASVLRQLICPGSLCFDVGANIGDYTASLLTAGARVIAIDPQPLAIRELTARFSGNSSVILEPVALGASTGTAEFYIRKHHETSSLLATSETNWETAEHIDMLRVPLTTLDELIT